MTEYGTLAALCEEAVWRDLDPDAPERLGVEINEALDIASYITGDGNPVLSVDAALTLVPGDWRVVSVGETVIDGNAPWSVRLAERDSAFGRGSSAAGDAATLPLALTAAVLRAWAAR